MMTNTPYAGVEGAFFGMPERTSCLSHCRKPHPPLWVASSRRETTMVGARLAWARSVSPSRRRRDAGTTEHYFSLVREECYPIGRRSTRLSASSTYSLASTRMRRRRQGLEGAQFFAYSLAYYYNPFTGGNHKPGKTNIYQKFIDSPPDQRWARSATAFRGFGGFDATGRPAVEEPKDEVTRALWRAAQRGGCIGSPEFIKDTLRPVRKAHLDLMIFVAQCGARKHEDVMDSIYRTGTKGDPGVQERHAEHQKWRASQLEASSTR